MNKNVKFLGATAAALLAVAPIATPVVANADTIAPATEAVTPAADVAAVSSVAKANALNVVDGAKLANQLSGIAFSNLTVVAKGSQSVSVVRPTTVTDIETAKAGTVYSQIVKVTLQTAKAEQPVKFTGAAVYSNAGATTRFVNGTKSGSDKLITVYVKRNITAYNEGVKEGTPFFTNKDGVQYSSFEVMNLNDTTTGYTVANNTLMVEKHSLSSIVDALNALIADRTANNIVAYNSSDDMSAISRTSYQLTAAQVKAQLVEQGFTVSGDTVTVDAQHNDFNLTLTAKNVLNTNTASVIIPASFGYTEDLSGYPVINMNGSKVLKNENGDVLNTAALLGIIKSGDVYTTVSQDSKFNPYDYINNIYASSKNHALLEVKGTTNDVVDTSKAGEYLVQYTIKNSNGLETVLNLHVTVKASSTTRYVNYVPGYGINTWNIAGNNAVFTGNRILHGEKVTLSSKTPVTKTINGTEFTQILKPGTTAAAKDYVWVESQYLSTEKPGNGETAVSGVLKVKSGYGLVHLTSGAGEFQQKAVNPGSSWKFVASKTVNGELMYKIGSDSEWIMAKYVDVI